MESGTAPLVPSATAGGERSSAAAPRMALAPLDGVRAVCCLMIMCGHLFMYGVPHAGDGPYPLLGLEFLSSVSLFMVLSGFTLVAVYGQQPQGELALDTRAFLWRRFTRLAPVYYASLLVALPWLLCYTSTASTAVSVPVALLMLQSLAGPVGGAWNGPLWQISALVICYAGFPALLRRLRTYTPPQLRRLLRLLAAAALLLPLLVIGAVFALGGGFVGATFMHTFGPYRVVQFAMGVAGGLLAANGGEDEARLSTARLNGLTAALAASGAACIVAVGCLPDGELRFLAWMALNYLAEYGLPLLQVHWVVALTLAPPGGRVTAFLTLPPLRWLGDASYAVYCLHWPVIMWCGWAVVARGVRAEAMPLVPRGGGAIEGWYAFPGWAVPVLVAVCVAVGGAAERLLGSAARRARKAAFSGAAVSDRPSKDDHVEGA